MLIKLLYDSSHKDLFTAARRIPGHLKQSLGEGLDHEPGGTGQGTGRNDKRVFTGAQYDRYHQWHPAFADRH